MNSDQKATAALLLSMLAILSVAGFVVWKTPSGAISPGETEQSIGDTSGANLKTVLGLNSTDPNMAYNWTDPDSGDLFVFNFTNGYWTIFDLNTSMTIKVTSFDFTCTDVDLQFSNGTAVDYVNLTTPMTLDFLHTSVFYGQVPIENYTALVLNGTGLTVGFEASIIGDTQNMTLALTLGLDNLVADDITINYTVGGACEVSSATVLTTYIIDSEDAFTDLYIIYAYILWFLSWV